MNEFYEELFGENQPIPELLHSEYHRDPFETCLKCERSLESFRGVYEIQKIYRQGRPIWEHAICSECGEELIQEYSDESLSRIQEFMSKLDLHAEDTETCHLCESSVETGEEHMISALCQKQTMVLSPMILCIDCLDRMNALLSEETRDSWDDFVRENVPGMPAAEEPSPSDVPVPGIG